MKRFMIILTALFLAATASWADVADYEGNYTGEYSSVIDEGVFFIKIGSDGYLIGVVWSEVYKEADWGDTTIESDGDFTLTTEYTDATAVCSIDSSGNLEGTYSGDIGSGTMSGEQYAESEISQYVGSYSGTYTGDESGTWEFEVRSDGVVTGAAYPDYGGTYTGTGGIDPEGWFIMLAEDSYSCLKGSIDSAGNVSGYIHDPYSAASATFTGSGGSGSGGDDSGDGGGGGGCFIDSLF